MQDKSWMSWLRSNLEKCTELCHARSTFYMSNIVLWHLRSIPCLLFLIRHLFTKCSTLLIITCTLKIPPISAPCAENWTNFNSLPQQHLLLLRPRELSFFRSINELLAPNGRFIISAWKNCLEILPFVWLSKILISSTQIQVSKHKCFLWLFMGHRMDFWKDIISITFFLRTRAITWQLSLLVTAISSLIPEILSFMKQSTSMSLMMVDLSTSNSLVTLLTWQLSLMCYNNVQCPSYNTTLLLIMDQDQQLQWHPIWRGKSPTSEPTSGTTLRVCKKWLPFAAKSRTPTSRQQSKLPLIFYRKNLRSLSRHSLASKASTKQHLPLATQYPSGPTLLLPNHPLQSSSVQLGSSSKHKQK